jgi:hypothetical protein
MTKRRLIAALQELEDDAPVALADGAPVVVRIERHVEMATVYITETVDSAADADAISSSPAATNVTQMVTRHRTADSSPGPKTAWYPNR